MWETVIAVALQLFSFYLKYTENSEKAKKAYLTFLKAMEPHSKSCVKARESYMSQRELNLKKIKELQDGLNENTGD